VSDILKSAQDAVSRVTVKSALNPLLWLTAFATPILLTAAMEFDKSQTLRPFCAILVYSAIAMPLISATVAIGLAVFRPEKLQSEDYQLRQKALLIFEKMGQAPQPVDPESIVAIANPVHRKDLESTK
jgi:hypothetical protein